MRHQRMTFPLPLMCIRQGRSSILNRSGSTLGPEPSIIRGKQRYLTTC